jgi:mannosyltransferase OCH1-like enzyme
MSKENDFPKIIHQVYIFNTKVVPSNIKKRIETWKKLHPDYEHIFWDKKSSRDFIKKNYQWFLVIYDSYNYNIQRCDAVRYFILYHYGGIYSDNDLEPVKCITPLLEKYKKKDCILYRSSNSDLLTNDFMISKKKITFWKNIFNELILKCSYKTISKHLEVMYTTGPLLLDYVYNNLYLKKPVFIIDAKYINNCDISTVKPCYNKEAYLKRYEGNSWHGIDSTIFNFFYMYYKTIIFIALIIVIVILSIKKV